MFENVPVLGENNIIFSVSDISSKIKYLLEDKLGVVQIKGEISGLKIADSGHGYFSLKDSKSVIAATCWRPILAKINFKLEEGMEVLVIGKVTAYAGQSKYQISVESIQPNGIGAFIQILAERKIKFEKEGLFLAQHKKPIPMLPYKIGIITSLSGAVIRDIIHRINDRCKTNILIWPVSVQGTNSAEEVVNAINGFNSISNHLRPQLLIIARGGGSIEDLWSFNEEIVVRAAFKSQIPIISAIGHETDFTLLDFVADLRAPTPTAAAEFAVPVASDLLNTLNNAEKRLNLRLQELIRYYQQQLVNSNVTIQNNIKNIIRFYSQKIDELGFRFSGSLSNLLKHKMIVLEKFPSSRFSVHRIIQYKYLQYQQQSNSLDKQQSNLLTLYNNRLTISATNLSTLDYRKVIERGYAIIENTNGEIISDSKLIKDGSNLLISMRDGKVEVKKL
ncbi:MAG: exodeoxyribonuclease VII large subunit [Rickettsiaceae bacterium]|nr:exodeoxyribonuclease VII large subunit [Rickettsiaceae bacterium]